MRRCRYKAANGVVKSKKLKSASLVFENVVNCSVCAGIISKICKYIFFIVGFCITKQSTTLTLKCYFVCSNFCANLATV